MIVFLIFIFILGLLIIVHEFGHFIAAKKNGVRVDNFSLGFGPRIFGRRKGDTEYSLSLMPLGGYVKMAGDSRSEYQGKSYEYFAKSPGIRFQIIFAGPLLNYLLGFLCFWIILFTGYPALTTKVGSLINGYGAKEAGLEIGDRIIAVAGEKVDFWEDLQRRVQQQKTGQQLQVDVLRGNRQLKFDITLKQGPSAGRKIGRGIIGITPFDEIIEVKHGFLQSAALSFSKTMELTLMTYKGLWQLASGKISVRESVTGPLGIFYITARVAKLGLTALLHLIAVLSISLAIFNLLPLPVLDGGHLFLLGLEKLRKKALGEKAEQIVNNIGFSLIISLAVLVTYNDILRLYGDKIGQFIAK